MLVGKFGHFRSASACTIGLLIFEPAQRSRYSASNRASATYFAPILIHKDLLRYIHQSFKVARLNQGPLFSR